MTRKIGMAAIAFFILQVYFVRELLAAELLFVLLFASVFTVVSVCYALGLLAEFAWECLRTSVKIGLDNVLGAAYYRSTLRRESTTGERLGA